MQVTLKAARINAGLSQEDAGKCLSVTKYTIANWERGKSYPDAAKIKEIEALYGVRYDDIIFLPDVTLKA